MVSGLPFDDFRHLVASLAGPDETVRREAAELNTRSAARDGALGRAGEIAEWLAAWSGRRPGVLRPQVAIFAGTHGLSARLEDTDRVYVQDFVARCGSGDAPINQLCAAGDYGLQVFDLALEVPTADITADAALDERGCAATIAFGMEAVAGGGGLLVLAGQGGDAGRISACAVLAAVLGDVIQAPGASDGRLVTEALESHRGHLADPLEAMRRVGGRETAALAGAIVAARTQKVPIVLDGIAAIAAAAVVHRLNPAAIGHCLVADTGGTAQAAAIAALGLDPLLSLGMQGGDGSAGAMAAGLVQAAAHSHAAAGKYETRVSGTRRPLN
ncbi:MAG: nicotinate-nucleotide--dimethylbenzimidazole phosphoribosyltransferase [Rhizobiaceae bacterium]|nr:nicotinate-nucleotide--dimethylbenzimidazole phosphoribosyltransferase [Rhizobiaceae bacterium]